MKILIPEDEHSTVDTADAFLKEMEADVLARTIWGEARGEGSAGMQAVAAVIMNRVKQGGWWGNDVISVCQKPFQFSCWNKDDPNLERLQTADETDIHFATAKRIARRAVYSRIDDPTSGADHYHAAGISPIWAAKQKPVCVIGNHIFYCLSKTEKEV